MKRDSNGFPFIMATLQTVVHMDYSNGGFSWGKHDAALQITLTEGRLSRGVPVTRSFSFGSGEVVYENYADFAAAYWEAFPDRLAQAEAELQEQEALANAR